MLDINLKYNHTFSIVHWYQTAIAALLMIVNWWILYNGNMIRILPCFQCVYSSSCIFASNWTFALTNPFELKTKMLNCSTSYLRGSDHCGSQEVKVCFSTTKNTHQFCKSPENKIFFNVCFSTTNKPFPLFLCNLRPPTWFFKALQMFTGFDLRLFLQGCFCPRGESSGGGSTDLLIVGHFLTTNC